MTAMASENGLWSEIKAILTRDHRTTSHRLVDRFADLRAISTTSTTMRWLKLGVDGEIPQVDSRYLSAAFDNHRRAHTARRSRSTSDRVRWLSKSKIPIYRSSDANVGSARFCESSPGRRPGEVPAQLTRGEIGARLGWSTATDTSSEFAKSVRAFPRRRYESSAADTKPARCK